jgi:hypothetical protein
MKQIFLSILIFSAVAVQATVRTVSNEPSSMAQYNNIQAAVDASSPGDTIYVHGSDTMYPTFTITGKRLTIIGPGWSPIRAFAPKRARVEAMHINGAGSDYSEIQGLVFITTITAYYQAPNNLRFYRNEFQGMVYLTQGGINYSGYVFQGNYFNNGYIVGAPSSSYSNFLIQNNLMYASAGSGSIAGFTQSTNVLVDHNLFYGTISTYPVFSSDCRSILITNNIFVRRNASFQNTESTFSHNITYNAVAHAPWALNGNLDGGGNIANQDPQMGDQALINSGTNNPLLNFTIAAGPANNSASDGKDMGLLFDSSGLLSWTNSLMSRIPYIYSMVIQNPIVPAGGILNVQVEARRSN